jgi:hypothetical protein
MERSKQMTTYQIETHVHLYSNETLCEIVASTNRKWAWFKFAAKRELERRDHVATFGA